MFPRPRVSRQIACLNSTATAPQPLERWKIPHVRRTHEEAHALLQGWFRTQGWEPATFQTQAWEFHAAGESGLISVPTGHGKTLAAFGGPLIDILTLSTTEIEHTHVIYLAPLKALARDIYKTLNALMDDLQLPYRIHMRTGDSSVQERKHSEKFQPHILVTTPESLAVMFTQKDASARYSHVRTVIVDEWHELIAGKRGSLLELTLAKIKRWSPKLSVWGLSATLGNLKEAAQVVTANLRAIIITDPQSHQKLKVSTVINESIPPSVWFGSMGEKLLPSVLEKIDPQQTHLFFTNTRRAAEFWYSAICALRPEWADVVALHHGSLSKEDREKVETGLKQERVKIVVATSSLELGVDFPRLENIYQLGSVKSLGRALQRAGRGRHQPNQDKSLEIIPVSVFDALEPAAIMQAHSEDLVESRHPLKSPLDVVIQHILNSSFNDGFVAEELLAEIRSAASFNSVTEEQLQWCLDFLSTGGKTLKAYAKYQKIEKRGERYVFRDSKIERDHRLNIGTIVGELGIRVRFLKGNTIGHISENFAAKLKKGDAFLFSGRSLEFIHLRDGAAIVRLANSNTTATASWSGQTLSISSTLMAYIQAEVEKPIAYSDGPQSAGDKLRQALLASQDRVSHKPHTGEILVERYDSREGHHLFFYLWAGRHLHEGLGHLFAYRLAQHRTNTIAVAVNDYGIELLGTEPFPDLNEIKDLLLTTDHLQKDVIESLNFKELVRRQFREIARVSGLIIANSARAERTVRHLQMSAGLLFDVFSSYDPENPLLAQARQEVLENQLSLEQLQGVLRKASASQWVEVKLHRLSPFALALYLERVKSRVSTETMEQRVNRFQKKMFEAGP